VFAGVFMYLLIWLVHGLIYRWRATRLAEGVVDRCLARMADALRSASGRSKKPEPHIGFTPAALPEQLASLPHAPDKDA
jgi:hypothetical protein